MFNDYDKGTIYLITSDKGTLCLMTIVKVHYI